MDKKQIRDRLLLDSLTELNHSKDLLVEIENKELIEHLFSLLSEDDKLVVVRAAYALEKITRFYPEFLKGHEQTLLKWANSEERDALKWHLAPLLGRTRFNEIDTSEVWGQLSDWLVDKNEGRIARVNAMHAMFDIVMRENDYLEPFLQIIGLVKDEHIPSLRARLKFIAKVIYKQFAVKL